jgi:hypothetical protein
MVALAPGQCDCEPYLAAVKAIWRVLMPAGSSLSPLKDVTATASPAG